MNYLEKIKAAKNEKELAELLSDFYYGDNQEKSFNCVSCPVYNPKAVGCIYYPSCFPQILTRLLDAADSNQNSKQEIKEKEMTLFEKVKSCSNNFELALLLSYFESRFFINDYDDLYESLKDKAPSFTLSSLRNKIAEEHNTFRSKTKSNADINEYLTLTFENAQIERQKCSSENQSIYWNGVLSALSMTSAYINNQVQAYNEAAKNHQDPILWDNISITKRNEEDEEDEED